jgi:CHRD domain
MSSTLRWRLAVDVLFVNLRGGIDAAGTLCHAPSRKGEEIMPCYKLLNAALFAGAVAFSNSYAHAEPFVAALSGFNEIGALASPSGAILSNGRGSLQLDLDRHARTVVFTLTYSGLSSPVTVAHIHFGKVHVAGGVIVFFCGGGGQGDCPATGTVHGMITAGNVQAIASQNVTAGDFDALEDALITNTAYANVHTSNFPAGEIRGQIHSGDDD